MFEEAGPAGTVFYRLLFAALLLLAIWRPWRVKHDREAWKLAVLFGIALAAMNFFFYSSLDRIPLGPAVTFEFVGPLAVALVASRTRLDLLWVALAATGILLLAGPGGSDDALGIALALAAGGCWGAYILISARVGQAFSGGQGLAIAMTVGTALMLAPGVAVGGEALLEPHVIAVGAAVALLSSVIPYSFELEALRTIPVGVFGVLDEPRARRRRPRRSDRDRSGTERGRGGRDRAGGDGERGRAQAARRGRADRGVTSRPPGLTVSAAVRGTCNDGM